MKSRNTLAAVSILLALLLSAGCADNDAQKPLASAKDYLQKNDTKAATIQIKNALQLNPELGEARFLLGTILLKEGNAPAAEIELRKALAAKYPEKLVVPELARSMFMMGDMKKVVDEFGQTQLGNGAADASLQTTLATAYGILGKPDLTESALAAALKADPDHAPALILRARQKAGARDFDGALQTTEAVIAKDAGNVDALKFKGDLLLYAKGKPEDALAAFRKSIEVQPQFAPGHFAVLTLLMQQNKLDEAEKQLLELKRFAANNPQTKYFEAQLAYQKKDFKLAKDLSQQLLAAAPSSPRILELAGAVDFQLNALPQAEANLSAALQAAPGLQLARRLLITTYLRTGQPAKALAALNAGAGKDGVDPSLFTLAGQVHLQSGDAKKAEEYFAKALKLDPDNARKRTALALTHLAGGETASAFDELQNIAGSDAGISADLALISAHLRRNDFNKALAAVAKLEAKQPDKPLAAELRGRIQLAQKDLAAARKSFEQALKIDPSYFAAAVSLAALDLADKKPEDAKKRFENLLAKNPKNGPALLALADLAANRGAGKDEVAVLLNRAIEANPGDITPRLRLVALYLGAGDTKQAATAAQKGVTALPNSPELLDALGRVQLESGELNQALSTFGKLAAMQPLLPMPHMRLAGTHMTNKDAPAAELSVRKALELKPDDPLMQRGLIVILLEQKKVKEAMTVAKSVQRQRPKEAVGYLFEGDIHASQKDWDSAATAYRTGLKVVESTDLAVKLHTATAAGGKAAESDRFAGAWMKAHPKDAGFLIYLGDAAIGRKDYASAEKQYLAALQLRADNAVALNNLAWVTHQLHKPGGIAYAEKANSLAPNQPSFMDTLAVLLSANGEHQKAIALQVKAAELQPTNASLKLNLARIYIAAGDKTRAKAQLDSLAQLGATHPLHAESQALLKTL